MTKKTTTLSNKQIAQLLRKVAAAYDVGGKNFFKVKAYERAADAVEHATSEVKDLWDDHKLDDLSGIGKSIRDHLDELFRTGKVKHFEEIMTKLPDGMFEFLNISGIGPKTAYKLASKLNINSINELERAAKSRKIEKIAGFGQKSQEDVLRAIAENRRMTGRHLLPIAFSNAQKIIDHLKQIPEVKKADPLGSLRRMVATVGDIDIAVASNKPEIVVKHFLKYPQISRIIESGTRTASILLFNGLQIDLMVQPVEAYGALLQHFTGSKQHNIHLRQIAQKKGISLSEYGIRFQGKLKKIGEETNFYKEIGLSWIPPELREDTGEIETALNHKSPVLVELADIKGDLHIHSSFNVKTSHDLGESTFEDLIKKAKEFNYDYLGFSDHNPAFSTHNHKEVLKIIKNRKNSIEQLKYSNKLNLLNLLEVDILPNGDLAISNEAANYLDGIIAGIHSSMRMNKVQMTKRLIKAISNPNVSIISHPTGRLLKEREGYELDWIEVFKACYSYNKVLEINAWPSRLDLPDSLVKEAVKNRVKMIISTDSHASLHMTNMVYGVSVARRGWAKKSDIINTYPWLEIKRYFRVK